VFDQNNFANCQRIIKKIDNLADDKKRRNPFARNNTRKLEQTYFESRKSGTDLGVM